jgi:putative ABC transport system substrate-binding protein
MVSVVKKKRRNRLVIAALSLCITCMPVLARQEGKPVIGFLAFEAGGCQSEPFHRGMRELGYEDGKNMIFVCRHSEGRYDGLDAAAAELAAAKPDVLVVFGHAPSQAAQRATKTISVVMSTSGEPVAMGFVQSLARPGGNITGVSYYATELNIKRLEYLKTVVPGLKRLGVLLHSGLPQDLAGAYLRDSEAAGKALGFSVHVVKYSTLEEIDGAFAEMKKLGVQGVLVAPTRELKAETQRVADLGLQYRLPVVHSRKSFPPVGGLMSYGPDYTVLYHRTAFYVDRVLKGAKPAELPVEQPARFELHINLATAKALGLKVPDTLRLRADKVIE